MKVTTQYSIIGSCVGAFVLALIVLLLSQAPSAPIPLTPISQLISNQTTDNDDATDADESVESIEEFTLSSEGEQILIGETVVVTTELSSRNVHTSRSGGGGGGSSGNSNDDEDFSYHLQLFEGAQESDGTIDLSQAIMAVATTDDEGRDEVTFRWIDPSATVVSTETVSLDSGSSESNYQPDEAGNWSVVAEFDDGEEVEETFEVSYMVIPESPIGIIALLGTSLVTIAAFAFFRARLN